MASAGINEIIIPATIPDINPEITIEVGDGACEFDSFPLFRILTAVAVMEIERPKIAALKPMFNVVAIPLKKHRNGARIRRTEAANQIVSRVRSWSRITPPLPSS